MSYDQDMQYYGGDSHVQEDLWLDDLKSLLEDTPAPADASRSGHSPYYGGGPAQTQSGAHGPRPPYSDPQHAPRGASRPRQTQHYENMPPIAAPGNRSSRQPEFHGRAPASRSPNRTNGPASRTEFEAAASSGSSPRKQSIVPVIILGIIIILELAAIGFVAWQWIQWMS